MMPARVAMALQADGWYLRSEIIWAKANPMPESVRDRPTSAHEKLFLLTKSGDSVFWTHRDRIGTRTNPGADYRWVDQANEVEHASEPPQWSDELIDCPDCQGTGSIEVRESQISMFGDGPAELEPCARCNHAATETPGQIRRWKRVNLWQAHDYFYDADAVRTPAGAPHDSAGSRKSRASLLAKSVPTAMLNGMRSRTDKQRGHDRRHEGFEDRWDGMTKDEQQATGANLRNVWSIATQPFPGAHFATNANEAHRAVHKGGYVRARRLCRLRSALDASSGASVRNTVSGQRRNGSMERAARVRHFGKLERTALLQSRTPPRAGSPPVATKQTWCRLWCWTRSLAPVPWAW